MEKKKHENRACVTITKENVGDFIRFNGFLWGFMELYGDFDGDLVSNAD